MKPLFKHIFFRHYGLLVLATLLFLLSFVFNTYYSKRSLVGRERKLLENYIQYQQKDFYKFLQDSVQLRHLVQRNESLEEFKSVESKDYGIYLLAESIFGGYDLLFWSDQLIVPPAQSYHLPDGEYFQHLANGFYVVIKKTFSLKGMSNNLVAYAMIPVQSKYYIETNYLPPEFAHSKNANQRVMISAKPTNFPIKSVSGETLFFLDKKTSPAITSNDRVTIFLRFSSLILLVIFIHLLADATVRRRGVWQGVSLLAGLLVVLRVIIYFFPGLFNFRQFELFNPIIYGSSAVHRSLGDLLINSILFCWISLFAWTKSANEKIDFHLFNDKLKWLIGIVSLFFLILSTFAVSNVIRSMIADSKISFDVTNFYSLDEYSVVGFVVLACLSLGYYYFTRLLFRLIFPVFENRFFLIYFVIALTGLIYLTFRGNDPSVQFYIPVLIWLIIYTWLVSQHGFIINRFRINITGMLFWLFVFSLSIATIILTENKKKEWLNRQLIADNLSNQADQSNEKLLSIALAYLDNDFLLQNFHRFYDPEKGRALKDSLITQLYSGYLNKYDTRLYIFDANGKGLNNDDPASIDTLNTILSVQSKPSARIPGLYYSETAYNNFSYITKREITDSSGKKKGTLFIISNLKKYSSDALFPELFRQQKLNDPENSPIYSYAIYNRKQLIESSNKYPFPISLNDNEIPKNEFEKRKNGDFDELWYRDTNEKVIVVARKKDSLIEAITLFSWIFCAFLFMVSLVQLAAMTLKIRFGMKEIRKLFQTNIRMQVHSTIIFISILSFVIIGIATISFFITRYNRNNSDKLSRTMKIMVNEMQKRLRDNNTFDDVVKIYDSVSNFNLQKLVNDVADIHNVNVNVYDLYGGLQVSSDPNVYRNGVLSSKINPEAFYHLSRLRQVQHLQDEKIGTLSYLSIYAPVRDEDGKVYAYLNIPYFSSQIDLHQEISNFLVTIINLNAFIFLIAGVIALFITNRITRSFSLIGDKMKEVNLGKMNEAIVWNRNDEIGELVKEYNKMVTKLEESAGALAKSEREGAWREMARQVAHEIKNPLTPMKLSIQYLQKAIGNNQKNVKELTSAVANTLIEQIDHLSKIAADFAQFANIGNTKIDRFDLHDVLNSLKELYQPDHRIKFIWHAVPGKLILTADKTQMNRLFTNLFTNAVDACNEKESCVVVVSEERNNGVVRISVKDNGEGIAEEMRSKIFTPNFTTKSSGTGLGLAMCKSIVEQAHGQIWFETDEGSGTTFHVELPVGN